MFRQENGWPFPKFYGSCGRIIVESNEGKTIDQFFNRPFSTRVLKFFYLTLFTN